jgi:two-component system response regulator PhcR
MVGLLASAYAERDVAIAAVNEGQVFRILEKPLSEETTRTALREALALYRQRTRGLALQQNYSAALRETLGFVAHELATPLSTVRGYMDVLRSRLLVNADTDPVACALNAVERSALHCQSLMSTFVQSARDAYPGAVPQAVSAASLVDVLLHEYPFEASERDRVSSCVERDFMLPGQRDLLYFVLCTLTKNALHFLRDRPNGQLTVRVGCDKTQDGERPWMQFEDNGPGIEPELLNRLTHGPVSTRSGGSGMGLVFARRVVQSLGGSIELRSELGRGTTVVLYFQPSDVNSCAEEIR